MQIFKLFAIIAAITLVEISGNEADRRNSHEPKSLTPKQMRHLKRLLRLHGGRRFIGKMRQPNTADVRSALNKNAEEFPYDHKQLSEIKSDSFETPTKSEKSQIRISANDEEIFARTLDLQEPKALSNDKDDNISDDDYKEQSLPALISPRNHHKTRITRSVRFNRNGPLMTSALRRINKDPDQNSSDIDAPSGIQAEMGDPGSFENTLSTVNNESKSGPNISETISTPSTNGGVTKIEINLSFGCLFFCE